MNLALIKAVETYSERKYEAILEKYREKADETWQTRIEDQDSITTKMPKPLELPFRYLLKKSLKIHLYVLDDCKSPCPLPDGKRLVGIHRHFTQDLRLIVAEDRFMYDNTLICNELAVRACFIDDDDRGSLTWSIEARNLDGDLVRCVAFPRARDVLVHCANKTKVFFTLYLCPSTVLCWMDVATGEVQQDIVSLSDDHHVAVHDIVALEDALVVLRSDGIYVVDTGDSDNFAQTCFWPGIYGSVQATSNSLETTVVAWQEWAKTIDVFTLSEDGILSLRNTFSVSEDLSFHTIGALLVHQSLVFIKVTEGAAGAHGGIEVYNTLNGELVRTFSLTDAKYTCDKISTNGCELFCGVDCWDRSFRTYVFPIEKL